MHVYILICIIFIHSSYVFSAARRTCGNCANRCAKPDPMSCPNATRCTCRTRAARCRCGDRRPAVATTKLLYGYVCKYCVVHVFVNGLWVCANVCRCDRPRSAWLAETGPGCLCEWGSSKKRTRAVSRDFAARKDAGGASSKCHYAGLQARCARTVTCHFKIICARPYTRESLRMLGGIWRFWRT